MNLIEIPEDIEKEFPKQWPYDIKLREQQHYSLGFHHGRNGWSRPWAILFVIVPIIQHAIESRISVEYLQAIFVTLYSTLIPVVGAGSLVWFVFRIIHNNKTKALEEREAQATNREKTLMASEAEFKRKQDNELQELINRQEILQRSCRELESRVEANNVILGRFVDDRRAAANRLAKVANLVEAAEEDLQSHGKVVEQVIKATRDSGRLTESKEEALWAFVDHLKTGYNLSSSMKVWAEQLGGKTEEEPKSPLLDLIEGDEE